MGARKKISAEARKEALKTQYFAKLNGVPTSPRKMRLVADMIRGMEVNKALGVLKFSGKCKLNDDTKMMSMTYALGIGKTNALVVKSGNKMKLYFDADSFFKNDENTQYVY